MKKQLLREYVSLDYTIDEVKDSRNKNNGRLIISGVLQKADTENQNKRKYPRDILEREVENYSSVVKDNRAVGELDHPEASTVSLDKVSHIVREIWWANDDVMGRVEVLGTPKGKILESLLESGVKIGISSRGVGSTKNESDVDIVQDDYNIICFDIVSEPSTPGAFLFTESKDIEFNPNVVYTKKDRIWRALNDILI